MNLIFKFLIAVLAVAIPLRAATTYYMGSSTEANFNTAVAGMGLSQINGTVDFSANNGFAGTTLTNANNTGISFTGLDGGSLVNLSVSGGKLQQTIDSKQIGATIQGAGNIFAYEMHFNYTGNAGFGNWFLGSTNGASDYGNILSFGSSDVQFFGIVSTTPLTNPLFISRNSGSGSATLVVDNFTAFGSAAETPEPATLALMGSGLVILSLVRRRVRKVPRDGEPS